MILRIVKMKFRPQYVNSFLKLFNKEKQNIYNQKGCLELNLYRDINCKSTYFTYSIWKNEVLLNRYRNSKLFQDIWPKTKKCFAEKAKAWSLSKK